MNEKTMRTEPLIQLTYRKGEDGMMYPNLQISPHELQKEVRNYGQMWKTYMMETHPSRLSELIAEGRINQILLSVDEEAEEQKEQLIQELLKAQPMPKTEDTLERASHMNMITTTAEELLINEVILKIR